MPAVKSPSKSRAKVVLKKRFGNVVDMRTLRRMDRKDWYRVDWKKAWAKKKEESKRYFNSLSKIEKQAHMDFLKRGYLLYPDDRFQSGFRLCKPENVVKHVIKGGKVATVCKKDKGKIWSD